MKVYPADSSASAVVLHESAEYELFRSAIYGSELEMRVYRRTKILKESAFEEADLKVYLYSYEDKADYLLAMQGRITLPDGAFYQIKKEDFFEEESNERYTVYKASLPNVEVGAVVELEYQPFGSLRVYSLNGSGWVVNSDRPVWINITPGEDEFKLFSNLDLTDAGALNGQVVATYRGISAPGERALVRQYPEGEYWNRRLPEGVEFSNLRRKDPDKASLSYAEQIDVRYETASTVVNDFLYFQPVLSSRFIENPFQLEQRYYPVDFTRPIREITSTTINLPKGWEVDYIPESRRQVLEGEGVTFEYKAEVNNYQLKIETRIEINQLTFEPEAYASMKAIFEAYAEKLSAQVVLRKP